MIKQRQKIVDLSLKSFTELRHNLSPQIFCWQLAMCALWRSQKSLQTQGSNTQATPSSSIRIIFWEKSFFLFFYFRFVNALVYYGVFLSAPNIGGNFYLNFFLTSLIELPAIPAGVWAFNRFVEHRVFMKWTCFIKLLPILTLSWLQ